MHDVRYRCDWCPATVEQETLPDGWERLRVGLRLERELCTECVQFATSKSWVVKLAARLLQWLTNETIVRVCRKCRQPTDAPLFYAFPEPEGECARCGKPVKTGHCIAVSKQDVQ